MFYSSFGLLSLVLHIIINSEVLRIRKGGVPPVVLHYRNFLYGVTVYYISDILWGILYENGLTVPAYIDTVLYFGAMVVSVMLWSRYVVAYLNRENGFNRIFIWSGRILMLFEFVCLGINFFVPIVFSFSPEGEYIPGPARYITLLIQVLLFALTAVYVFAVMRKAGEKIGLRNMMVGVSSIVMLVFIVLQTLYSLLPFYAVGCLLATCLVHRYVAEDERIEHELELLSARQEKEDLEERLAFRERLLEREIRNHQADAMITAMAQDYRSVYYVDLDKNEATCYRANARLRADIREGDIFPFREAFLKYAANYVSEEDFQGFLDFIEPENIRKALENETIISYRYLSVHEGKENYEMLRMAAVRQKAERTDGVIHAVGAGFTDVDSETRAELVKNHALSEALNQAEEANVAKTAFLSSMSHEIRTPMNAIIGFNTIALKDEELSERTREYLEKTGASARHLLSLINDILDMSRIESGRMTIRNEEFSMRDMLEQINTMIRDQCLDKGLKYDCVIEGPLDDYYIGDDMRLKQIILNILGNAVKYTPAPGEVTFKIQETARYEGNASLRFVMVDTGIGMDREFLPKLFNPFSQEEEGRSNKYGSTGLGMAITRNIVDLMNGRIEVESAKGKGSVFTVTVTLKTSDRTEQAENEISAQELRVLIIDDNPGAGEHAREVMLEMGIQSDVCGSGSEACERIRLAKARQQPYNLILADWKMPGQDGVELTRTIRNELDDRTAIVILTAYDWDDIVDEASEAGVDGFIEKPLYASAVLSEYRKSVRRRSRTEERKEKAELAGRHILLAEDMLINAEIVKQLLGMHEMEVDHAENGKLCVDMFSESLPGYYSAILMDIRMPVMDGLKAAESIRALDREDARTIPIIAMTANAFDEDVQRSLQAGMNAHLSKPVEANRLIETLEALIRE